MLLSAMRASGSGFCHLPSAICHLTLKSEVETHKAANATAKAVRDAFGHAGSASLPGPMADIQAEVSAGGRFLYQFKLCRFGLVLIEATACGLPLVSTRCQMGTRRRCYGTA
ncbi:hypothetical protein CBM2609_A130019 [Cupriavidus taiwanensis]|nr:hypothetical protein CBM2604_A110019 [Cupriavidus taiwanensis]SOZ24609.1 hypothetical protein CBM2609_A130019 [Cupriavidus taiwanensis]SOZ44511.1 hypothetical protein CBM2610_A140019 [Cupriavidus taiwanensis]